MRLRERERERERERDKEVVEKRKDLSEDPKRDADFTRKEKTSPQGRKLTK